MLLFESAVQHWCNLREDHVRNELLPPHVIPCSTLAAPIAINAVLRLTGYGSRVRAGNDSIIDYAADSPLWEVTLLFFGLPALTSLFSSH